MRAELQDSQKIVSKLSEEVRVQDNIIKSQDALINTKQQEVDALNVQVGMLKTANEKLRKTAQVSYHHVKAFLELGDKFVSEAGEVYGQEQWFQRLKKVDKLVHGLGPLPHDYRALHWKDRGYRTEDRIAYQLLFCEPGWDNDVTWHGKKMPTLAYPAWAHKFYDPDPPRPQWVTTGIVENLKTRAYPKASSNTAAMTGANTFFQRLDRLFAAFTSLVGDPPPPLYPPGGPFDAECATASSVIHSALAATGVGPRGDENYDDPRQ